MNKPLIISLNELKTNLTYVINNAMRQDGLPCYLIEPILSDMLAQIREGSRSELQIAHEQMSNRKAEDGSEEE